MRDLPWQSLRRYRVTLLAAVVVAAIGLWPLPLAPLGRGYVAFCARFLAEAPFRHHYPPLLVAFVTTAGATLLAGFALAAFSQIAGQRRFETAMIARRREPSADERRLLATLAAHGRVVITSDATIYAFCGGLLRPRVYVSDGLTRLLTREEAEAVLRHELHHVARRDPLRFFVSDLASRLSTFFPVLAGLNERLRVNAEVAADRASLRATSVEHLAGALVKVLRAGALVECPATIAALSPTEARVRALRGDAVAVPLDRRDLLASLAFALVVAAALVSLATQSLPLPPPCDVCPPF